MDFTISIFPPPLYLFIYLLLPRVLALKDWSSTPSGNSNPWRESRESRRRWPRTRNSIQRGPASASSHSRCERNSERSALPITARLSPCSPLPSPPAQKSGSGTRRWRSESQTGWRKRRCLVAARIGFGWRCTCCRMTQNLKSGRLDPLMLDRWFRRRPSKLIPIFKKKIIIRIN